MDTIPSERLVILEASEGWKPLCEQLEIAMPTTEFPRTNSTEEFQARFRTSK